jgi:hypothetical protein
MLNTLHRKGGLCRANIFDKILAKMAVSNQICGMNESQHSFQEKRRFFANKVVKIDDIITLASTFGKKEESSTSD